eukprot:6199726-Pleurochrysis_carterae.AAC.3
MAGVLAAADEGQIPATAVAGMLAGERGATGGRRCGARTAPPGRPGDGGQSVRSRAAHAARRDGHGWGSG